MIIAWYTTNYGLNWRIVFWIGAIVALIGAKARILLRETPDFTDARKRLIECKKNSKIYTEKWLWIFKCVNSKIGT